MCSLYTIGYEGTNKDDFINRLIDNNIKILFDVREMPLSRKPGFSKTKLKELLEDNGIQYYHYRQLGSPKDIRHKLHEDKNYDIFFQSYRVHISSMIDYIVEVINIAEKGDSCLLCFENNPQICHRSILADVMKSYSNNISEVVNII